jgi:hypothetical protein
MPFIHITSITQVFISPKYVITVWLLTFKTSAATRIRRQRRHNPQFDYRPISRFEDAEKMRTWLCPQEGCGQVQFSVLSHGDWYSNVHGMTIDSHSISGPTHSWDDLVLVDHLCFSFFFGVKYSFLFLFIWCSMMYSYWIYISYIMILGPSLQCLV